MNDNVTRLTCIDVIKKQLCKFTSKTNHFGTPVVPYVLWSSIWKYMEIHTDTHVDIHEFIWNWHIPIFDKHCIIITLPEPFVRTLVMRDQTKHLHTLHKP